MATQNFDQLNNLRGYAETWFSKMNVSDEDKKKRVNLAMDFTEIMLMLFELIMYSKISKDAAKAFLVERAKIIADNYVGKENTAYITNWSRLVTEKIVEDTYNMVEEVKESEETEEPEAIKDDRKAQTSRTIEEGEVEEVSEPTEKVIHFDEYDVDIPKDEYPTSDFRGLLLGVECATSVANYYDFYDAVERNGATKKVWISEADDKVRATHDEAHGQERQINKLFVVGDSELMFPGDITHGADMREIYNCRCHVEYVQNNSKESGAIYGAYTDESDPYNKERERVAENLYTQWLNRNRQNEIEAVANNTGFSVEDIERIFAHIFEREHLFADGSIHRFDPDYYMAMSWQRLREGKNIQPHDIILLQHELAEEKIMGESLEIVYENVHNEVQETYNYQQALMEYLKTNDA